MTKVVHTFSSIFTFAAFKLNQFKDPSMKFFNVKEVEYLRHDYDIANGAANAIVSVSQFFILNGCFY